MQAPDQGERDTVTQAFNVLFVALVVAITAVGVAVPAFAATTASVDDCRHQATVAALHECVAHAEMMGHITSPAIAARLHSFLDQADVALARGQEGVAANWLRGFIRLVDNGAAHGLLDVHAAHHLVDHAALVIDAVLHPGR